ncbi:MAG: MFS transporter [Burkholderiaceae bacterium]|nr:MFS transporter [Burkholderiaceae bacterium]
MATRQSVDQDKQLAAGKARTGSGSSAWAPFEHAAFRTIWFVSLFAFVCAWMSDVASAWIMASLTRDPLFVALVQTASALPVFLFSIVSGVFADTIDRRLYLLATQCWVSIVAAVLLVATLTDSLSPALLLALTFANGIGMAMRWPVMAALTAELVPRDQISAAVALNGIIFNVSRIAGPMLAGAFLVQAAEHVVFAITLAVSLLGTAAILRWKRAVLATSLPPERFGGALRVGARYVVYSPRVRVTLVRIVLFGVTAIVLFALAPLIAMRFEGADANTYTLLLAAMGLGALMIVLKLAEIRRRVAPDRLIVYGTLVNASTTCVVAWTDHLSIALAAAMLAGMGFVATLNTLHAVAQLALPDWVRARGMAWVQMATMGSSALGAAVWGLVARWAGVEAALFAAGLTAGVGLLTAWRMRLDRHEHEDLTSVSAFAGGVPAIPVAAYDGPVVNGIRYSIDPSEWPQFAQVMRESRARQLKHGALAWNLYADASEPDTYVEQFIEESWTEHLRRIERMTEADLVLAARKQAFHRGPAQPRTMCWIARSLDDARQASGQP